MSEILGADVSFGIAHDLDSRNVSTREGFSEWDEQSEPPTDYVFDRIEVKVALVVAYTAVFCCCFFGNMLVMLAIVVHRRMRTLTNFFLANLAFADFCVSIFCIYQNMSWYLLDSWPFGDFLCRMNHFVQYLSYTSSVVILTIIAAERFVAIVYPMRSKHWITATRLRRAVATVWLAAAIYSSPRFVMYGTDTFPLPNGRFETICYLKREIYNSKVYDTVNFVICYLIPLALITGMYARVGHRLWHSGSHEQWTRKVQESHQDAASEMAEMMSTGNDDVNAPSKISCICHFGISWHMPGLQDQTGSSGMHSWWCSGTKNTPSSPQIMATTTITTGGPAATKLRARRKVIRMLIAVVLNFAICNLPFHARKMCQYFSSSYDVTSNSAMLATPISFLLLFMNSAMNPILYAFMSVNFRKSMKDVIACNIWRQRRLQGRQQSCTRSTTMTTAQTQPDMRAATAYRNSISLGTTAAAPSASHGHAQERKPSVTNMELYIHVSNGIYHQQCEGILACRP